MQFVGEGNFAGLQNFAREDEERFGSYDCVLKGKQWVMSGTVVERNAAQECSLDRKLVSMSNPYGETYEYGPEMEYWEADYEWGGEAEVFSGAEVTELSEQLLG